MPRSYTATINTALALFGVLLGFLVVELLLSAASMFVRTGEDVVLSDLEDSGGTIRILCIGESTTHGLNRSPYPEQLERILNERADHVRFVVYNEGVPSTTSNAILLRFPSLLAKYRPHYVISMFGLNDEGQLPLREEESFIGRLRVYQLFARLIRKPPDAPLTETSELRSELATASDPSYASAIRQRLISLYRRESSFQTAFNVGLDELFSTREQGAVASLALTSALSRLRSTPDRGMDEIAATWLEETLSAAPDAENLGALLGLYRRLAAEPAREARAIASYRGSMCTELSMQTAHRLASHRFDGALEMAERYIRRCSQQTGRHRFMGDIFASAGRFQEAAHIYDMGGVLVPKNFKRAGRCHLRLGQLEEAVLAYAKASIMDGSLLKFPPDARLIDIGASLLLADVPDADADGIRGVTGSDSTLRKGETSYYSSAEAIGRLESILSDETLSWGIRVAAARKIFLMDGDPINSGVSLDSLIQLVDNPDVLFPIAQLLERRGLLPEAESVSLAAVSLNDESFPMQAFLFRLYKRMGSQDLAARALGAAHRLASEPDHFLALASLYRGLRKHHEALRILESAATRNDIGADFFGYVADALADHGKDEAAIEVLRQGAKRYPQLIARIGTALAEKGDYREAVHEFRKLALLVPDAHSRCSRRSGSLDEHAACLAFEHVPAPAKEMIASHLGIDRSNWKLPTEQNYRAVVQLAIEHGAKVVAMQYPRRDATPLRTMLASLSEVAVLENRENFNTALKSRSYEDLFFDQVGGDFGHCTALGNRLIAENVAGYLLSKSHSYTDRSTPGVSAEYTRAE